MIVKGFNRFVWDFDGILNENVDGDGRRAGGVAMYVSSEFAPRRRFDLETNEFELLWVEVKINSFTLLCGVCYSILFTYIHIHAQV